MENVSNTKFVDLKNNKELTDRKDYAKKYESGLKELGYDILESEASFSELIDCVQKRE